MRRSNKREMINKLIEIISREGGISVGVASKTLGISEVTARRYLNELASHSSLPLKRVRGGILLDKSKKSLEYMFDLKLSMNSKEKMRIAKRAAEFVEDGDSLIIDSGTTAYYFAKFLMGKRGLKVISADVKVAEELAKNPDIETYIIGGIVRPGYFSVGGDMAVKMIKRFHVDKVFLTADAVDLEGGITNFSSFEAYLKESMISQGKKVFLMADHTKIGKVGFMKVASLESVNVFITSKGIDEDVASRIKRRGIELIVV